MGIEDFNIDDNDHAEKILLISANDKDTQKLIHLFNRRGYKTECVLNHVEAAKASVKQLFDLIVLDSSKADKDLDATVSHIRSDTCLRRSPLLLLHSHAEDCQKKLASQTDGDLQIIQWPGELSSILVKVATLLRIRKFRNEQASFEAQLALQNAELRDLTNRFKHELREARSIQLSLLPKRLPEAKETLFAAYCVPLEAVGGDLFDIWPIGEGAYALFIADVTGHGMPAAFIGAMTKMALSYSPKTDPSEMIQSMNEGLVRHIIQGRFVTAAVAFYSEKSGLLRIARAGHPPPLLWRSHNKTVEVIEPKGLPLGIVEDAKYELFETVIEVGDKLLMFSDGLTETFDMDGNMLGSNGATSIFKDRAEKSNIADCITKVLGDRAKFSGGRILKDDLTVIGFERLGQTK